MRKLELIYPSLHYILIHAFIHIHILDAESFT